MANQVRILVTAKDEISGQLDKIRDKAMLLSKTDIGKGMVTGAGIAAFGLLKNAAVGALDSVVQFGVGSIAAASDLNETMSKSRVIFGDSADELEAWASTAADAFGSSKRQALDTASGFAGLFQTVGIAAGEAKGYAMDLTELGSDLASFFNTDVDQALQAIKSGLAGESEPLRKFNVFLSETAVSAKLAELGIKKTNGAYTEAEKATARYKIILEQTGAAQGDFNRTSDGLANSQRTVAAQMEDLSASVGEELLPVMLQLMTFVKDEAVPALKGLTQAAKDNEFIWDALANTISYATGGPLAAARTQVENMEDDLGGASKAMGTLDRAAADAADGIESEMPRAGDAVRTLGKEAQKTRDAFWSAMDDIVEKSRTTHDDLKSIVTDAIDSIYEPERRQMRLTAIEADIAAERRTIADTEATEDQKANSRARIRELEMEQEEITTLQVVLGEAVDANGEKMSKYVKDWAKAGPDARKEINLLISALESLARKAEAPISSNFSFTGKPGKTQQPRAAGGPVTGGETYLVGEKGPELFTPAASGAIIPNHRLGTGGGGTVLNLTLNLPVGMSPGAGRELGEAVGPAVVDYIRRTGALVGMR